MQIMLFYDHNKSSNKINTLCRLEFLIVVSIKVLTVELSELENSLAFYYKSNTCLPIKRIY